MKFLTPQALASAVIGHRGSVIAEMERSSQAFIVVSKVDELYPKSECRVLTASAETEESLNIVARQLLEKLTEVVNRSQGEPGGDGGQLRISVLVPKAVVLGLVSDGGKGIRRLCENSSAMVKIKDPASCSGLDASQEVQLRGRQPALTTALEELNQEVQLVNSEPWFYEWAISTTGVPRSGGSGESATTGSAKELSAGVTGPAQRETRCGWSAHQRQPSPERSSDGHLLYVMKVLAPPVLADTFTGPLLTEIEQKAQAKVRLSDPEECFPRTDCRVLTARADTEESLNLVAQWFVERLAEVAETNPSDAVIWEERLRLSILVPKVAAAGLIGREGLTIKQLCDTSGSYIRIGREVYDATQKADVKGSAKSFEQVFQEVNAHVNALRGEHWFHHWASTTFTSRHRDSSFSASRSGVSSLGTAAEAGMELVGRTMERLPRYVHEEPRGFSLTCIVPARLVGSVMGHRGEGLHEVQKATKTLIQMSNIPGDANNQTLSIAGPLLATCSAYMLMMKRYLDAEKEMANDK